jgi:hypothetical protein
MDVAAVICIRGDHAYFENCLTQLIENDVSYAIIDNGMEPESLDLLRTQRFGRHLIRLAALPYDGVFELRRQMAKKEELFDQIDADWLIHLDVDEEMHSYREGESLAQALRRLEAEGYNVVAFQELVFLPVDHDYVPACAGRQPMSRYYYYEPPNLMRARLKSAGLSTRRADGRQESGHKLFGADRRLSPERLAMRHYIARDQAHALAKYADRIFSPEELAEGWHRTRAGFPREAYLFPPASELKALADPDSRTFDLSDPKQVHYWERWPA